MAVKPKLKIYNQRMLELMDEAIKDGKADFEMNYLKSIGFDHSNISKVKSGANSFKISHLMAAAQLMNVSIDWICGISKTKRPNTKEMSAIDLIKEGLRMLESAKSKSR